MKERPPSKEHPPHTFGPISCIGSKFYSNERPPWSGKLHVANGGYLWSLRSTATSAMHI